MSEEKGFKPTLGLFDGTMLVAGSMIGSGIFIVSADITRQVGSPGWLLIIWLITGFMTLTAALSYGELASMFPKAGGQYVYLKNAFNSLTGFMYGWSFFAVIQTATIAAVGVAFSKFAAYLFPVLSEDNFILKLGGALDKCGETKYDFTISAAQIVSILLIFFLTYVNTRGVKEAKFIQKVFTSAKLLALFGLILFGLTLGFKSDVFQANWSNPMFAHNLNLLDACNPKSGFSMLGISGGVLMGAIAAAMVGSVFSSDAWNNVTFIAGEIKNPSRNVGLSLLWGTVIVTFIYILINFMYTAVLPMSEIASASKDRVAVAAANSIFGNAGTYIIAILIMISTFGCNNGLIMSGARVYHTMANDNLFFTKKAGILNKNGVPEYALWLQCIICCLWCLSGKYGQLLDMISFVVVLFYVATIIGIFKLRVTQPNADRPYKAFGYPILPAIYIVMGIAFCLLLIIYKPEFTWPGLYITLAGIPIYFIVKAINKEK